jgi:hypothetical protein
MSAGIGGRLSSTMKGRLVQSELGDADAATRGLEC